MPEYRIGNRRLPDPNTGPSSTTRKRGYIGGKRTAFTWGEIPVEEIGGLIHAVTADGCAIICGRTSDGGALSITILDGDERHRTWPHNIEEFRDIAESCGSSAPADRGNAKSGQLFDVPVGAPEGHSKAR